MAVDHGEAGHIERCACCGVPLSQSHGQALEGSYGDYSIPSRDQGFRIDVCAGSGLELIVYRDAEYANEYIDRRSV